ncbi:MAG: dimethylsulfoniopropionate demethylase [Paracoccaceae bacterium]|nr:dimethylsulfoniopropionate demethylase [Paracoccaceae bacterium]MDH5528419.1 dimethylsulfoniopropionate demethylase [Paracoccaceae bacterium]
MADGLNMSRRIRRTPYTDRVEAAGVRGFSVVNHMLLPKAFQTTVEEDYWHLRTHVQIWDVSCQRQVEISGPDAARLVQWMTPRNIGNAKPGDCLYVPIIDDAAGLINDPVLLKLAEDRFWLSIADSDVLLYAKGLAIGAGMDLCIQEPDVSPLAIQGPKSEALMTDLFGSKIRDLGFFKFGWFDFQGTTQLIARSGYSRQGGFEIYLNDTVLGPALWDAIWVAGQPYNISPGCPNLIERIEGGLLSYGNEMTRDNNPLEIGLGKFCTLDGSVEYVGRKALEDIAAVGPAQHIRGVIFGGGPCPICATPWPVMVDGQKVGQITSAIWSPRLKANVGLSMIESSYEYAGQSVVVWAGDRQDRFGHVSDFPM